MADQVGRKKSYRWVSASQASYDGSEWDSDDDGTGYSGKNGTSENHLKRKDTISNLPALPKLNYQDYENNEGNKTIREEKGSEMVDTEQKRLPGEESDGIKEIPEMREASKVKSFAGDDLLENYYGNPSASQSESEEVNSHSNELDRKRPKPLQLEEQQDVKENKSTPNVEFTSSMDSLKDSLPQKTPVNEDLDNLMAQISREMEEQQEQQDHYLKEGEDLNASPKGSNSDEDDNDDHDHDHDEGAELGVAKNGYFSGLVHSDKESARSSQHDRELGDYSPENHLERNALASSLSYSHSSKETGRETNQSHEEERIKATPPSRSSVEPPEPPERSPLRSPQRSPLRPPLRSPLRSSGNFSSRSPVRSLDSVGSSLEDSEDDALSFTESLNYHGTANGERSENNGSEAIDDINYNKVEEEESDGESVMRVHKSGYFGKMVSRDDDDGADDNVADNTDAETIRRTDGSDNESGEGVSTGTQHQNGLINTDNNKDKIQHGQTFTEGTEEEKDNVGEQVWSGESKRSLSDQKSVNSGEWIPDTGAARSGFLQETTKKAPPGYVYDENGELINLTPSSMKPRAISTYSEMGSAWNPFPEGDDGDDLGTVGDTKTIYDNQTIYNVPGLITNNQNLPPLPNLNSETNLASQPTGSNSSDPKSLTVDSSIATVSEIDGERDKGPLRSHFHEVLNASAPDLNGDPQNTKEIGKSTPADTAAQDTPTQKLPIISTSAPVPSLDLNKLINSKSSHVHKIQELQHYYDQLLEHDTGIQAWIEASLKSSAKPEKGYLFEQYKVNKHVKDAYANADEFSKKHTVTNTVASVNQNVSQLKKKVFLHPIKSRGLFSSIGKKKI
ncbi:Fyv8p [Zygosaccharomyces mellis]|uniref:Fyv8p n=1 Tax=Zygosaccharomyces mellis TaxID=42258 RepID=A0A4C2E308_9SACH|nr:Fyv8p [Zygosaccharomyces mellis]